MDNANSLSFRWWVSFRLRDYSGASAVTETIHASLVSENNGRLMLAEIVGT